MPAEQVDAIGAGPHAPSAPARRSAPAPRTEAGAHRHPIVSLLQGVSERRSIRSFRVRKGDELVVFRRAP
jgi:hypothetical protein